MDAQKLKQRRAERRQRRVRKAIRGSAEKPRLSVHRTNLHIYAQLIDDEGQVTLAAASSNDKGTTLKYGGNIAAAIAVGKALAEKAKAKGIKVAAFDRGHFRYHGRVKALARAATEAGLVCTGLKDETKKAPVEAAAPAKKEKGGEKKKEGGEKKPEKAKA